MNDYLFAEVLNRQGSVSRAAVTVEAGGLAREAVYGLVQAAAPLRLRPVRGGLDDGLLGLWPSAGAVAYLAAGTLRARDRLGVVRAIEELAEDAEAGAVTLALGAGHGIVAGDRLHLRGGGRWAEVLVAGAEAEAVTLDLPLGEAWAKGAQVETVVAYEVLGVEDPAGAGHHQRAVLRGR
jgi:hypothetical protein